MSADVADSQHRRRPVPAHRRRPGRAVARRLVLLDPQRGVVGEVDASVAAPYRCDGRLAKAVTGYDRGMARHPLPLSLGRGRAAPPGGRDGAVRRPAAGRAGRGLSGRRGAARAAGGGRGARQLAARAVRRPADARTG